MIKYFGSHTYGAVFKELKRRIQEPAPGRVQIVTGPRQVGKTTLLLQLAEVFSDRVYYVAADTPEAALPAWWDLLWQKVRRDAARRKTILLIDEIQYLPEWSRLLKAAADEVFRRRIPLQIVVSGSSALRVGTGSRESMTGRFERLEILHWPASELTRVFRISKKNALERSVTLGSYPGAVAYWKDFGRWRSYVRESIIEPALSRDALHTESVRRPALLRQIFALATGHPAEIISLQKIAGELLEKGALETVAHYLKVLEDGYLVAALQKYSEKTIRQRASPPKLITLNQSILAAMSETIANPTEPERWGRWIENACLAFCWNSGQKIYYWRDEPLEVDLVLEGSWGKWAIEVTTGNYSRQDLKGLMEFNRRFPDFRPLLLCGEGKQSATSSAGITVMPWREFLWDGPSQ